MLPFSLMEYSPLFYKPAIQIPEYFGLTWKVQLSTHEGISPDCQGILNMSIICKLKWIREGCDEMSDFTHRLTKLLSWFNNSVSPVCFAKSRSKSVDCNIYNALSCGCHVSVQIHTCQAGFIIAVSAPDAKKPSISGDKDKFCLIKNPMVQLPSKWSN